MWSPSQTTRTHSSHSVALSIASMTSSSSSQNSYSLYMPQATSTPDTNYGDHDLHHQSILSSSSPAYQDDVVDLKQQQQIQIASPPSRMQASTFNLDDIPSWNPKKRVLTLNSPEHFRVAARQHHEIHQTMELERRRSESIGSDDTHATLAGDDDAAVGISHDLEMDLKTPTVARHRVADVGSELDLSAAGPMSHLLHSLLLRVADVEHARPTVTAEEHNTLQKRVTELERENLTALKSHNALLAIRNEDLANLIKVRGLLAEENREHAAFRRLREDDLENVLALREKLAKATWSGKLSTATASVADRRSSGSGESVTPIQQKRSSKSDSADLWQQAKTAAMEQRVLELEKANAELRAAALAQPVSYSAPVAVAATATPDQLLLTRVENMFEDSLRQRERMATRMQLLRSEKEGLLKEVAGLEDRNGELEALVERLKRGISMGH